jgi:hypothetical protein
LFYNIGPWPPPSVVVVVVQGDVEKDLGWKPIPLFDREHREDIASMQVLTRSKR